MSDPYNPLDTVTMQRLEFQSKLRAYRAEGYKQGWDECMKQLEDHLKYMREQNATI